MHRYQISSTTSISRTKAALIKNDILENKVGEISFQDPIYVYWLKTEYFANNHNVPSVSEPFLYLLGVKNAIFHKFLYRTFEYLKIQKSQLIRNTLCMN